MFMSRTYGHACKRQEHCTGNQKALLFKSNNNSVQQACLVYNVQLRHVVHNVTNQAFSLSLLTYKWTCSAIYKLIWFALVAVCCCELVLNCCLIKYVLNCKQYALWGASHNQVMETVIFSENHECARTSYAQFRQNISNIHNNTNKFFTIYHNYVGTYLVLFDCTLILSALEK